MTLTNTNNKDPFDPTPKLKSSPLPILFIPFNNNEVRCSYCNNKYFLTVVKQKYCKNCLSWYIRYTTGNNIYLDVHISTNDTQCTEHETTRSTDRCIRNVQEWCEYCSEISYFRQIAPSTLLYNRKFKLDKLDKLDMDIRMQNKIIEKRSEERRVGKEYRVD